jgi:hypothetical protein
MVLAAWVSTQRHPQRHNNTDPWPVIALFLAIGLYILFGRYFIDMRRRASTYYAITDERAIILSGTFRRKIKSLNLRTVSDITVSQRRDGTGTISFGGSDHLWFMSGFDFWATGLYGANSFERIPNVKEVYEQIRKVQRAT